MIILLRQVVPIRFLLHAGVPLSAENVTRTEPTKSTIDLAVKSIKEQERQQK